MQGTRMFNVAIGKGQSTGRKVNLAKSLRFRSEYTSLILGGGRYVIRGGGGDLEDIMKTREKGQGPFQNREEWPGKGRRDLASIGRNRRRSRRIRWKGRGK